MPIKKTKIEYTGKGYAFIRQNPLPKPGTVAERNSDYRVWLPAGKSWKVIVEADGEQEIVVSGISSVELGKKFCLNIRPRVTDRSDEPIESVELPPGGEVLANG